MARGSRLVLTLPLAALLWFAPADATVRSVSTGPAGPAGQNGADGQPGASGRGITATSITAGHLVLTYSDGSTADVGQVVGANGTNGANGAAGAAGRGIQSASVNASGRLILTYTDGSTTDVGAVVGSPGANGANGTNGKDGATPTLAVGTVTTGAAGSSAAVTATQNGTAYTLNFAIPQGQAGATGAQGPVGPKSSTFVCNATLAETLLVAIGSGIRTLPNVTCTGVLTTDILEIYPTSPGTFPANYAVHHALPSAAGKFTAVLSVPALAIGASYSIPVAVYAVNR